MSLYHCFKPSSKAKDDSLTVLPSPEGHLSKVVPPSTIVAANEKLAEAMAGDTGSDRIGSSQGTYENYTPTEKAKIANYALLHGTAAALRHL
uniref:Uncharacterized protein n=1 Tax=Amphimedon queenslandica TaxID=400682 RepID=A0A1X7UL38_AMPQE